MPLPLGDTIFYFWQIIFLCRIGFPSSAQLSSALAWGSLVCAVRKQNWRQLRNAQRASSEVTRRHPTQHPNPKPNPTHRPNQLAPGIPHPSPPLHANASLIRFGDFGNTRSILFGVLSATRQMLSSCCCYCCCCCVCYCCFCIRTLAKSFSCCCCCCCCVVLINALNHINVAKCFKVSCHSDDPTFLCLSPSLSICLFLFQCATLHTYWQLRCRGLSISRHKLRLMLMVPLMLMLLILLLIQKNHKLIKELLASFDWLIKLI